MTQEHIADATGLTAVHVNRMLRTLREDGALKGSGRDLQVADWKRLKQIAVFRTDYLHLAAYAISPLLDLDTDGRRNKPDRVCVPMPFAGQSVR